MSYSTQAYNFKLENIHIHNNTQKKTPNKKANFAKCNTYEFSLSVPSNCPLIFHMNIAPSFEPAAMRLISRLNDTRDQSQLTLKLSLLHIERTTTTSSSNKITKRRKIKKNTDDTHTHRHKKKMIERKRGNKYYSLFSNSACTKRPNIYRNKETKRKKNRKT